MYTYTGTHIAEGQTCCLNVSRWTMDCLSVGFRGQNSQQSLRASIESSVRLQRASVQRIMKKALEV